VGAEDGDERVDFDAVRKNAAAEGIDLSFVAIKYEGLTVDELDTLKARGRFAKDLGPGRVLGSFGDDGVPLFPEKATAVFLLGE
jgi:hypothetical protein